VFQFRDALILGLRNRRGGRQSRHCASRLVLRSGGLSGRRADTPHGLKPDGFSGYVSDGMIVSSVHVSA
jgi:hypothetical protein